MRKKWRKIFGATALAFMLCLTGLVMSGEAQAQRFVDNDNGTVTDIQTGLTWTKDANPIGRLNWDDAMTRCASFSINGFGGWRLPSKDELLGLYTAMQGGHFFTGVHRASAYWSSTSFADDTAFAWAMNIFDGYVYPAFKPGADHVWPVRDGQ